MPGPSYGTGGGNLDDLIARAQAAKTAEEDLDRKEKQRQGTQERGRSIEQESSRTRGDVAEQTGRLSQAITRSTHALAGETDAVNANTSAWVRNAQARAEAEAGVLSNYSGATRQRPAAAAAAPAQDPLAYTRRDEAIREQAAAEARYQRARGAYGASVRPSSTASTETQAELLAQQEEARRGLAAAKAQTAAAERSAAAQDQLAQAQRTQLAEQQRINAELEAERAAAARMAAAQAAAAGDMERAQANLRLSTAGNRAVLSSGASAYLATGGYGGREATAGSLAGRASVGSVALPSAETHAANAAEQATRREAAHAAILDSLSQKQREATQGVNAATAAYADSSQVLSRHGALTTEFIQAFARGQVTLRDFTGQMVSTIGKFGGWAVAGGLVYGAYEAIKHLGDGAKETQAAVQQLGRFIPGLGGPAGGGKGQIDAAQNTVRNISTEFNVPIKDVVDAMQVMARVFHNVSDAGDATRAVLAAQRLDQIPQAQSEQYLIGISQSLDIRRGSGVVGVVNSLNALQSELGARVSQTLPALARAAPAALAGGLDTPHLEALVALGVRSGISGNQVGTALLRSIGTFAFRPQSEATFRQYGITPRPGNYGDLASQVFGLIDQRQRQGKPLAGEDLRQLAQALGGPLLGSKSVLPILEQEQLHPGAYDRAVGIARNPRPYQEDLNAVLGTASERFKSLGIALEAFGSRLAQIGAFAPITAGLNVMHDFIDVVNALLNPLTNILGLFGQLPGPVRDLIGVLVAVRAARAVYSTSFGSSAQGFIGRLPGLSALDTEPRQAIRGTVGRLQTYARPQAQNAAERADARLLEAQNARAAAVEAQVQFEKENASVAQRANQSSAQYAAYKQGQSELADDSANAERKVAAAELQSAAAGGRLAQVNADIAVLRDRAYSTDQKIAYLKDRELYTEQELVDVNQQAIVAARARIEGGAAATVAGAGRPGAGAGESFVPYGYLPPAGGTGGPPVFGTPAPLGAGQRRFYGGPEGVSVEEGATPGFFATARQRAGQAVGDSTTAAREFAGSLADRLKSGQLTTPLILAGVLGSQAVGNAVGGGVGSYISNVGGTAATGALLAQMLGKGGLLGAGLGTVAGSFQQGSGSGVGSLVGGALGAGVGTLLGGNTAIGFLAGSALGSVVGGLFGGGNSNDAQTQAQRDAQAALQQGRKNQGAMVKFSDQFVNDLATSFSGTGSAAQKAQSKISAEVQSLTAELQLFGSNSSQGKAAREQLNVVLAGALSEATTNPAQAQQLIQGATQARQQYIQSQLQYNLSTAGPGGGQAAAAQAASQYQQLYNDTYGDLVTTAQDGLTQAQQTLTNALKRGNQQQIRHARKGLQDAKDAATAATNLAQTGQQANVLAQQAAYQAAYSSDIGSIDAQGQLAQSQAGGDQSGQLQAQLATAQRDLGRAQLPGLDPTTQANEIAKYQAQINDTQTKIAQQGLAGLQSQGAVREARIPTGDPVAQARQKVADLTQQYNYMRQHREAFDPNDVRNMLASIISAKQAAADAATQYATTMNDISTQIREAQDQGNSVQQAADAVAGASRDLQLARTPQQRAQAKLNLIQAQNQQHQAVLSNINAQAQLTEAQQQGDNVAQAQTAISAARTLLANAHGIDEQTAAQKQLLDAQNQYHQALVQRTDNVFSLRSTEATGDSRQQARLSVGRGRYDLSQARGPDEVIAAYQEIAAGYVQEHQADQQYIQSRAQLREARAAGNPVRQAQLAVQAARDTLAIAHGTDEQVAAETQLVTAQNQLRQARIAEIQANGQLRQAQQSGNSLAQAQTGVFTALGELGAARTPDERRAARTDVANARAQLRQARVQRAQSEGGLLAAESGDDPVQNARIAVAVANQMLRIAHGTDEQIAAQTALAQAQNQLHQALQSSIGAWGQLQASTTRDPLKQLAYQIQAAEQQLGNAKTATEVVQDQTQLNQLRNQYADALLQQSESTIDFQLQMKQITTQQAIKQLQGLLGQAGDVAEQQQILLKIRQLQTGDGTGGQFNLAPGTGIKLPTVYDVQRATAGSLSGRMSNLASALSANVSNHIVVMVNDSSAAPAVYDAIERATSSGLQAQLRAAGVIGG